MSAIQLLLDNSDEFARFFIVPASSSLSLGPLISHHKPPFQDRPSWKMCYPIWYSFWNYTSTDFQHRICEQTIIRCELASFNVPPGHGFPSPCPNLPNGPRVEIDYTPLFGVGYKNSIAFGGAPMNEGTFWKRMKHGIKVGHNLHEGTVLDDGFAR